MALRVLIVADEPAGSRRASELGSFDWMVETVESTSVVEKALSWRPHVVVIDLSFHPARAVEAGLALRMIPNPGSDVKQLHGLPLLFVGGDEHWHDRVRAQVPAPAFVAERDLTGELWALRSRGGH